MSELLPAATTLLLLALLVVALWRPALACGLLMLLVPLTTGLARGSAIPLLKPSEAMVAVVVVGAVVNRLPRPGGRQLTWLDLAMVGFAAVGVVIPTLVLLFTRTPADLTTWRTVLAPAQLLVVYLLFSRTAFTESELRLLLGLSLLGAAIVGLVAVAELIDLPGLRSTIGLYYPSVPRPAWETTYRPDSLVGHYSAVGGICLFGFILAAALSSARPRLLPSPVLALMMLANAVGIVASQTFAPFLLLPLAAAGMVAATRRVTGEMVATAGALGAGLLLLWPSVSGRVATQGLLSSGQLSLVIPESMRTRMRFWNEFIVPALQDHLWLGTGTVIPGPVPATLSSYVDNEFLWAGFRAGLPGVASLLLVLGVVAWAGWAERRSQGPWRRVIGLSASFSAVAFLLVGLTAQYLTFGGLVQQFGMIAGLLGGMVAAPLRQRRGLVLGPPEPAPWQRLRAQLRPDGALLASAGIVFGGFAVARLLGFLFSVAAARVLAPAAFGSLVYGIAIVGLASVLLSAGPNGLARFLARSEGDPGEQSTWLTNWVALLVLLTAGSAAIALPAAALAGLGPAMLAAVAANLAGISALETYREAQRGLGRYWELVCYYVLANFLQLAAILGLAAAGVRSAPVYLAVYGLSGIAPLPLIQLLRPLRVSLRAPTVSRQRMIRIAGFVWPVLLQSVFYAVWLGFDVIVVQRRMGSVAAGNYGAAKTLVNVLILPSAAISTTVGPRVARLAGPALRRHVLSAVVLTLAVTVPLAGGLAMLAAPICRAVFGARYPLAPVPVGLLALGMSLYALYSVLASTWIGLGRPRIDAIGSGAAMVTTVVVALLLVPALGLPGAAAAFAAGSGARLATITVFTAWAVATRTFMPVEQSAQAGAAVA